MPFTARQAWLALTLALPTAAGAAVDAPGDRQDPSLAREQLNGVVQRPIPSQTAPLPSARPANVPALAAAVTPGAIRVEGVTVLPASAFAATIQPYLGRSLSARDLSQLAGEIAAVLRKAGYGLASAAVPQQKIDNGILRVFVDEGRIDAVDASGDKAVERVLRVLADGKPVRTEKLERQLLLAEDLAGATLDKPAIVRREGRNVLTVKVYLAKATGRLGLDNWGSNGFGPVRATLGLDVNRVIADDDHFWLGAAITPAEPREFQYVEVGYGKALGSRGTELAASGYVSQNRSRDVGSASRYDGDSEQAELRVTQAVARSRRFSGWVTGDFAWLDSGLSRNGQPARGDTIATGSAVFGMLARTKSSWLRGRIAFVQGLDALGATDPHDPLASRRDASGRFSKLEFYAAYAADLAPRVGLVLATQGQFASRPLLVSQEIGLGGQSFLRAFDYREVSGDEGAAASAELRYDFIHLPGPFRRGQFYVYGDAGRVTNLAGGFGGGRLASAGGGLRAWLLAGFEGSVEVGVPLTDSPFNHDPAPRFSFTLSKSFQRDGRK
jgi:hemolysin activation/secretion protein